MFKYRAYGVNISSEIYLPELIQNESEADVKIIFQSLADYSFQSAYCGEYFKVTDDGVFLFWKDQPYIRISDGDQISIDQSINVDHNLFKTLLLGTAFAILMHQQGFLVLHASSIKIFDNAIAFLGDVGQGKSTTAFAFTKKGYKLISDDILPIQINKTSPHVYPGYPRLRLSADFISNTGLDKSNKVQKLPKYLVEPENGFASKPIPLKQIYILEKGNKFGIKNLSQKQALFELINYSYCFPSFSNSEKSLNLLQCNNIIKNVEVKKLTVENSLDKLSDLVKIIEEDLKE